MGATKARGPNRNQMINIYIISLETLFSPIWFLQCWPLYFYPPGKTFEGFPLLNTSSYKENAKGINTEQWPQDWKKSVFIPIPKKGNAKECSNYHTIALISHASKVMLKILQARFQQYMNCELPDFQDGFRKGKGTRDQIANIHWIIEKARVSEKHLFLLY